MTEPFDGTLAEAFVEVPHEFEVELNTLVVFNHQSTLEAIDRAEEEAMEERRCDLVEEDSDTISCALFQIGVEFEDLRKAANELALVGVVTRFQHWVGLLFERATHKPPQGGLVKQLNSLNSALGSGPVPITDFKALVEVRDSIIHHDSNARWHYNRQEIVVADRYRSSIGRIDFSQAHLREAVTKTVHQIFRYDEALKNKQVVSA